MVGLLKRLYLGADGIWLLVDGGACTESLCSRLGTVLFWFGDDWHRISGECRLCEELLSGGWRRCVGRLCGVSAIVHAS